MRIVEVDASAPACVRCQWLEGGVEACTVKMVGIMACMSHDGSTMLAVSSGHELDAKPWWWNWSLLKSLSWV